MIDKKSISIKLYDSMIENCDLKIKKESDKKSKWLNSILKLIHWSIKKFVYNLNLIKWNLNTNEYLYLSKPIKFLFVSLVIKLYN